MKVYEKVFSQPNTTRALESLTVVFSSHDNIPYITIHNWSRNALTLDEARKMARCILAIPRPCDAGEEK